MAKKIIKEKSIEDRIWDSANKLRGNSDKDRDTREVFGDDIDIYDMTQAVKDGATRPVYYESRVRSAAEPLEPPVPD